MTGNPVEIRLGANQASHFNAGDLENGAQGLTGTLGDGAGKWRLFGIAKAPSQTEAGTFSGFG